ncbi:MAG: hypothetical protein M0P64_01165 [Candidatus Pacebacteria bacterium]|jgi:hypothetical protein|nr:hypothetical protein [Candidatus Paceibacterota bacterium]
MKFIQNLVSILFLFVLFVGSASADITDLVNSTSATPSAASAPEAAKPAASALSKCAKNYGRAVLEDNSSKSLSFMFNRVGLPFPMVDVTVRHAVKQAGCFTLVEPGTAGVKFKLKMEMAQPVIGNSYNAVTAGAVRRIPLFGGLLAQKEMSRGMHDLRFTEAMVTLSVVDMETGESIASVLGQAKSDDTNLGVALMAVDTPDVLSGEISKNISMQVIATEFADGFNKLVPAMDKLNAAAASGVPAVSPAK